ncbi:hypothetical protein RCL_jg13566.t1 [Rhizophagus clarus]|uniref:Uncharacterized protein n=1 Tax=Rhizophagus clarus TaxID=94130 RepID=A0A8H3LKV3_9GLOM|nr:hypothetical protein RCL_jg13566.t1 [Rhizophagus clarus]
MDQSYLVKIYITRTLVINFINFNGFTLYNTDICYVIMKRARWTTEITKVPYPLYGNPVRYPDKIFCGTFPDFRSLIHRFKCD